VKSHTPIYVTVGAVVLGLLLSMVTASWLESPQDKNERLIDEQVDLAQRMLANYAPAGSRLSSVLGAAATQPAEAASEQWPTLVNNVKQDSAMTDTLQKQSNQINTLSNAFKQLDGKVPPRMRPPGSSSEAYRKLDDDLKRNETQIASALRIVQAAIQQHPEGSSHTSATTLEAILCYHQADLLRRQAAVRQSLAEETHVMISDQLSQLRKLDTDLGSLASELNQSPETQADADTGNLIAPSTLSARVAQLKKRQTEVADESQAAEQEVQRLTNAIAQIEQRITEAGNQARSAEQRMFELEKTGIDPTDPESLNQFIDAYNEASAVNRAAFRESTILQLGALRNAHVDTTNEDDILTQPLVSANADRQITPERGLRALQSDLKAAQALVQTLKGVAREIDRQLESLAIREKDLIDRQKRLQDTRSLEVEQIARSVRVAIAALIEADTIENNAINLAQGQGARAAQRARTAAAKRISDARSSNTQGTNPRLTLISQDGFITGHTYTVAGDLHQVIAQIYAQRAKCCDRHSQMLADLEKMGFEINASDLPEGMTLETAPASAIQSEAAQSAAQEARTAAIEAGKAALEQYDQADGPLKQLWVLHANMGAVHYLLANVTSDQEAAEHRENARIEYHRALLNREDRPEATVFKTVLEQVTEKRND